MPEREQGMPNLIWIAGIMKSGTTWLRDMLAADHLLLASSPVKEFSFMLEAELRHYREIDTDGTGLSDSHLMTKRFGLVDQAIEQIAAQRHLHRKNKLLRLYQDWINPPCYELSERGFRFYETFIRNGRNRQFILDSSVENAMLSPATINRVKQRYPGFKVIILLRDPVSRLLSHANMMFGNQEDHSGWYKDVDDFLSGYNANNDYGHIISNFRSVLDEDQLLIRFHDEITDEPEKLVQDVRAFIGLPPFIGEMTFPEYHPVKNIEFTPAQKRLAWQQMKQQIQCCAEEFPDSPYPKRWLNRYTLRTKPLAVPEPVLAASKEEDRSVRRVIRHPGLRQSFSLSFRQ